MEEILRFLIINETLIYMVLGLFFLYFIKKFYDAWIRNRNAFFGLEKEIAQKGFRFTLTIVILTTILLFSQFSLVTITRLQFPGLVPIATPTLNVMATPTLVTLGLSIPRETPEGFAATQTAVALTGCVPGQLEWTKPLPLDEVSGSVELRGTVNVPNLGFYKYEYQQQGTTEWVPISAGNRPVNDEPLGTRWGTSQLQPGMYFLRLVVSDNQNRLLQPCVIDVKVIPQ